MQKHNISIKIIVILFSLLLVQLSCVDSKYSGQPLSADDVLVLLKSGYSSKEIEARIKSQGVKGQLSDEKIKELKAAGASLDLVLILNGSKTDENTTALNELNSNSAVNTGENKPVFLSDIVFDKKFKEINNSEESKYFKLSEYKGKPLVIIFWAEWCPPCLEAAKAINGLEQEYSAKNLQIIGFAIDDRNADENATINFIKNNKIAYRNAWATRDYFLLFRNESNHKIEEKDIKLPAIFLVKGDGEFTAIFEGFPKDPDKKRERMSLLKTQIEKILQ